MGFKGLANPLSGGFDSLCLRFFKVRCDFCELPVT